MQKLLLRSFFRLAGTFGKHLREQTIVLVMNTILALMYLLRHIFSSYLAIVCDIDLGVMPPLPPPPPPPLPTTAEEHRKEIYFNTTWEFSMRFSSICEAWWFLC